MGKESLEHQEDNQEEFTLPEGKIQHINHDDESMRESTHADQDLEEELEVNDDKALFKTREAFKGLDNAFENSNEDEKQKYGLLLLSDFCNIDVGAFLDYNLIGNDGYKSTRGEQYPIFDKLEQSRTLKKYLKPEHIRYLLELADTINSRIDNLIRLTFNSKERVENELAIKGKEKTNAFDTFDEVVKNRSDIPHSGQGWQYHYNIFMNGKSDNVINRLLAKRYATSSLKDFLHEDSSSLEHYMKSKEAIGKITKRFEKRKEKKEK